MSDFVEVIDNNNDNLSQANTSKFTSKVFGYMGIGLAITAIVTLLMSIIFTSFLDIAYDDNLIIYLGVLITSLVVLLITSIWIRVSSFFKKGRAVVVPFVLYAVAMGVMLSSLTMFVPGYIIAITLGITTTTFFVMFLIGYFAKSNLSTVAIVASGLVTGAFMIILMNLIIMWFFPVYATMATWLASGIIFIAMMLFTIVDIRNVRTIAESGLASPNLALYCAFNLYVDFIYMFIRILRIVIIIFGNNRR